mgnify:CR=1 FL=1
MGKLHILACKRHLEDLKRQGTNEFPYIWKPEKSERILEYAETLTIGEGFEATPVKLLGSQIFDIGCPFGWLKLNEKSAKSTYIILALSIIMLVIVGIRLYSDTYAAFMQKDIASQIIRFHIRANDDSEEAQNNKMLVKAAVLDYISPKLSQSVSLEESRQILSDESDNIKNVAVDKLRSLGSKEDVSVYFENCYFPMKSYGDMTFPPGEYEAFRIDIGEASGRNWWCVLYPPLCFVDAVYGVVPDESKDELKNVLTEDEYRVVSGEKVQYRFKYLKFLNKK